MCNAKPRPRCAAHTADAAAEAAADLKAVYPHAPAVNPMAAASPDFGERNIKMFVSSSGKRVPMRVRAGLYRAR